MSPRLRKAQIRLRAELLRGDINSLYRAGPTRGKVLNIIAEHGELKIQNEKLLALALSARDIMKDNSFERLFEGLLL